MEAAMARPSKLSLMSVESLIELRDDVSAMLSKKADELQRQLARLTDGDKIGNGRKAMRGSSGNGRGLKGRKVAPKYRDPKTGETWSGRGAPARWLTAYEKQGKKRDSFLIDKSRVAASRKTSATKKSRRKKK
jgi:DNA-binding protein H-NS